MKTWIAMPDHAAGPFEDEELLAKVERSEFSPDALACREGGNQWVPLRSLFPSLAHLPYAPPPLPAQGMAPPRMADDAGMRMLLPVGRSGWAIAAGYLGLVSVMLVPAPFAVICSIMAIRNIRASQKTDDKKHGMGRAIFGLIMGIPFTGLLCWLAYAQATK